MTVSLQGFHQVHGHSIFDAKRRRPSKGESVTKTKEQQQELH